VIEKSSEEYVKKRRTDFLNEEMKLLESLIYIITFLIQTRPTSELFGGKSEDEILQGYLLLLNFALEQRKKIDV
jgi:hypothetical protein